jgi:hypothetical protein
VRPAASHPDINSEKSKRVWLPSVWSRPETAPGRPDALLVFSSEEGSLGPGPADVQPSTSRRRFPARDALIALLALVAIVEGAAIAVWWMQGRGAGAPIDSGTIVVTSAPAGATVFVNQVSRGITPFRTSLAPGSYNITVGDGGSAWSQAVAVAERAEASVHVQLQTASSSPPVNTALSTGTLQITTDPPGAQVLVDNAPRGVTPLTLKEVAPGVHTISMSSAAGSQTKTVTVDKGAVSTLVVSLGNVSGVQSGWLAISSPIPAQIREGGALIGNSEMPRIMLAAGQHDLQFENSALGFRVQRAVRIAAGKTTALEVEVPNGSVAINALPWAEVWVNGRSLGETPIGNVSLPIGSHELVFRHPQLGERRTTVLVRTGAPIRVGLDLRKAQP